MKEAKKLRAPAVPLIVNDPMTSIWSFATNLTDDTTRHWTGGREYLIGVIAVDGELFDFLGKMNPLSERYVTENPPLTQKSCTVRPMTTVYELENEKIRLELKFTTPLLLDDLDVLSRPVTYLSYRLESRDGKEHACTLYFGISGEVCVNSPESEVFFGTTTNSVFVSSGTENMLKYIGDERRMEWGTMHVIAPTFAQNVVGIRYFIKHIRDAHDDPSCSLNSLDFPAPRPTTYGTDYYLPNIRYKLGEHYPTITLEKDVSVSGENAEEDHIIFLYDDEKSLQFFGENADPYWKKDGDDTAALMKKAMTEYGAIMKKVSRFEDDLLEKAAALSPQYADILSLAYRQTIGGHKLTYHDGEIQFVSKECFSNGCAATVDVTYPSVPLFLMYNPALVEGMLNPVFKMIEKGFWNYEFAPHDVGTYPLCNSQSYGFYLRHRRTTKDPMTKQMPVEECGNMLLCVAGICYAEKRFDYFLAHEEPLRQWAEYLVGIGTDPDNQLCTDDFAGHLAHNCNLSVKGICGIAAFGKMLADTGRKKEGKIYLSRAKEYAARWEKEALCADGSHYKLAFDQDDSWSIKYNMVWDKLLNLGLFSEKVYQKEIAYYKTKFRPYGLPLDNRADYTKSDWQLWATALCDDEEFFREVVERMWRFLNETRDRTPFTDFYFTTRPIQRGFQARTVQGGLFIKLLHF